MNGRLIVLTDLDDTWFMSHRRLRDDEERTHLAAVDAEGKPLSYQSPPQHTLWDLITRAADIVVPVTGRTSYAIERVTILPAGGYAVASHGALVLQNGTVLPEWRERLAEQQEQAIHNLQKAEQQLAELINELEPDVDVGLRVLYDLGVPVYLSIKCSQELPSKLVQALHIVAQNHNLKLHANSRNAALRPPYTCKAEASLFLLDRVLGRQRNDTVITLGDSLSDLGFMTAGDMAVVPTDSQIWTHLKEAAQ